MQPSTPQLQNQVKLQGLKHHCPPKLQRTLNRLKRRRLQASRRSPKEKISKSCPSCCTREKLWRILTISWSRSCAVRLEVENQLRSHSSSIRPQSRLLGSSRTIALRRVVPRFLSESLSREEWLLSLSPSASLKRWIAPLVGKSVIRSVTMLNTSHENVPT